MNFSSVSPGTLGTYSQKNFFPAQKFGGPESSSSVPKSIEEYNQKVLKKMKTDRRASKEATRKQQAGQANYDQLVLRDDNLILYPEEQAGRKNA